MLDKISIHQFLCRQIKNVLCASLDRLDILAWKMEREFSRLIALLSGYLFLLIPMPVPRGVYGTTIKQLVPIVYVLSLNEWDDQWNRIRSYPDTVNTLLSI